MFLRQKRSDGYVNTLSLIILEHGISTNLLLTGIECRLIFLRVMCQKSPWFKWKVTG